MPNDAVLNRRKRQRELYAAKKLEKSGPGTKKLSFGYLFDFFGGLVIYWLNDSLYMCF